MRRAFLRTISPFLGLLVFALLICVCAHAQSPVNFTNGGKFVAFPAASATGAGTAVQLGGVVNSYAVQAVTTGSPAACTYDTEGSLDGGTTWFKIVTGTVCTTNGTITYTVDKPVMWIRFNVTALTATKSVAFYFAGK